MRGWGRRRDPLPCRRGHPADLAPHSGSVPPGQLPLSDLLRSVPDRPDVPCPPSRGPSMSSPERFVDVRGPRFAASVTSVVLAVVLLTSSGVLLAAQAVVFAAGAFAGMRWAPYGLLFRTV